MTQINTPGDHLRAHREAWAILPFFVNGTLDAGERALVEEHLAYCVTCRAEVSLLKKVERSVRNSALVTASADQAWNRLAAGIVAQPAQGRGYHATGAGWLRDQLNGRSGLMRGALAVQVVLLVVAGVWLMVPQNTQAVPDFQTLASTDPTRLSASLRVRFADEVPEARMRALLLNAGLRIVDGPSEAGLYLVALTSKGRSPTEAVDRLRGAPDAVRFVEVLPTPSGTPATAP